MFSKWAKAVFWGGTARSFWTFGTILSAILSITPIGARFPQLRVAIPLGLFIVGFFVSSYFVYLPAAKTLEQVTTALTVTHRHTLAGEQFNATSKRHAIVADIYLTTRNQSADGNSIRVHTCSIDAPEASLEYLQFFGDEQDNMAYHRPSDVFSIRPKSENKPVAKAVFTLPESPFPIAKERVTGRLEIIDIHDRRHSIEYSASLEKNKPITEIT